MEIYVSSSRADARKVVYSGLMEIAVDSMTELIQAAEAQSIHAQVAELKVRVDHLMHMRESDRREYIESMNKSSESRAKMHEKMDGMMDKFRTWESKFQWWLIGILGAVVMQMIFIYLKLN